ncbi:MAG: proline--tRNA ligase [Defluviitaleaceae bacterium]|nr:proline--tRNA ligase [Defluviitaleaceae bacterium]MCL2203795.1 proline--tRNA ligase [Defluviitaleaceae bacterium]MCL2239264.1 proline--tRNA ligase [Defluviitaleaceae bacterium]
MPAEKRVEKITDMNLDFPQWYTDVVRKADLADYSETGGCIIVRPYGYGVWELITAHLDAKFKETGHENMYMPLLIPESLLEMEKDHIEGFAPEVAWVTHAGNEELTERFYIRPTSEPLFSAHYAKRIQSWRDLPCLYNQWCTVMRWEKTTRPFLRGREFMWQEGHTAHATKEESLAEALMILDIYSNFCENVLCIPVIKGQKTEREKFAGAMSTYTFEALMHDGKALQSGTTHDFGDKFARVFNIQYTDKNNQLQYATQSSWGVSSRLVGAIIMVHGDNNGLVLPPGVAPVQLMVVPVAAHKPGVREKAEEIRARLAKTLRCKIDNTDHAPGWKFAECEMKGIPLRLEIGPKDIENNQCVLVRRDTGEKITAPLDGIEKTATALLEEIRLNLFARAKARQESQTFTAQSVPELKQILDTTPGFVKAMWCGADACEVRVKEEATATSRCIPFTQERVGETCFVCGGTAEKMVVWSRAY